MNSIAKVSLLKCPNPILSDVFEQFVRQVSPFNVKAMGYLASAPRQCQKPGCLKQAHPTQGHGFCCYGCSKNWACGPLCTGVKTMKCWRPECHRMKHSREGTGYCCWGCKRGQGHDLKCESRPFHSEPAAPVAPAMGCVASVPPPPWQCKKPGCLKQAHPKQGHGFCCYGCSKNWACGPLCTGVKTMKCWRPECHRMKHSREGTGYCCWGCKRGQGHDTKCENRPFRSEPAAPAAPAAPAVPAKPEPAVPVVPAAQPQ